MYNAVFRNSAYIDAHSLLKERPVPDCYSQNQLQGTYMTNPLFQKDIISVSEFTKEHIELILKTARELKKNPRNDLLKDKLIGVTFFEGSTRTRLSFETAIHLWADRL